MFSGVGTLKGSHNNHGHHNINKCLTAYIDHVQTTNFLDEYVMLYTENIRLCL